MISREKSERERIPVKECAWASEWVWCHIQGFLSKTTRMHKKNFMDDNVWFRKLLRDRKSLLFSLDYFSYLRDFSDLLQYIFFYFGSWKYLRLRKPICLKDQNVRKLEDLFRVIPFIALYMRIRVCAIRYVCMRALLGYIYTYIRLNTLLLLAREDGRRQSRCERCVGSGRGRLETCTDTNTHVHHPHKLAADIAPGLLSMHWSC